jgi:hypothetical protein
MPVERVSMRERRRHYGSFALLMPMLLCFCFMPPIRGNGQHSYELSSNSAASRPGTVTKASDVSTGRPGQFYDQALDLHFNYPIEMQTLDAAAQMERGHQNVYGVSGDNDPEHLEAKRCARPLLLAELPSEKAPQRTANMEGVWVDDSKEYKESRKPVPIFAQILFVEIVRDCLPKKLRKNDNDALGNVAMSFVSLPGIQRMPKPLWYEVGKQKIHMNSAVGRPIINGQLASAPIIVMSMTTQWRGHLLAWVFTANDTEIFNEITKSLVQFGDGGWGPMFGANLGVPGSAKPITILPK